jgi:hypothetical protein
MRVALWHGFLRSIEMGRNVTGYFLTHAHRLAEQEGLDKETPLPDHIWGRAVETFDWELIG